MVIDGIITSAVVAVVDDDGDDALMSCTAPAPAPRSAVAVVEAADDGTDRSNANRKTNVRRIGRSRAEACCGANDGITRPASIDTRPLPLLL
mmetsp:Transcript_31378/g.68906  ORF Transcript_31378/g.68906 Transcript_31378/m.68906 type:complete len:92 (+) Transcript_31378:979-1254(+)